VQQPDDEHFHFGYNNFEPFFNVVKGLLIAIVGILAFVSAVGALFHGGREINTGYAVIYAIMVSIGCFSVWALQRSAARKTGSPLVVVDAKNWLIDGYLTAAVLVAFGAAWLMQGTSWEWAVNYVDPGVVAVLVIVIIPVPYIIIRDNLNEVLLGAPGMELQEQVQGILQPELTKINASDYQVRMVKVGRALYVDVYLVLSEEHPACHVPEQDLIRENINFLLARDIHHVTADVSFTLDAKWAGFIRDIGEPWTTP
jgi:predicted Co/Zn/Cd cation transporter (cation efflux family)